MTSKRVKTLLKNQGSDFFSRIGKMGFQTTTERYFNGDRKAHFEWLRRKGAFTQDKSLSYHKPEIFSDPGPHPSEYQRLKEWLDHAEANILPYNGPNSD